ncbi:MAG: prolipoprotein diacylglyceryl transferase [Paludibacteraceae bacterium]
MLQYIVWNVQPQIFNFLPIRWYGLMWAIGIFLALLIVQKIYRYEKLPEKWIDKQFIYVVVGTVLGARLGHCLFYEWHLAQEPFTLFGINFKYENYYITHPWQIFNFFNGGLSGLASHGGAIGIIIAMYLYDKKVTHKGFLWGMDRLVIGAAVTGACIRFGNLLNSEIYGSVTTMPWGFIFVRDPNGDGLPHHPTQIYEMLYCIVTFVLLWGMYWKKQSYKKTGLLFGVFLIGIFGTRFLLEFIKLDQETFESGMLLNMGQILSIPLIIWGIWLIIRAKKNLITEEKVDAGKQETLQNNKNDKKKR